MAKAATVTTDATTAPAPEAPREAPIISPRSVTIDAEGHCLRTLVVRLPADFEATDLAEPSIWSRVQGDRAAALRKLDRLVLIAHDEGYVWTCFVAQAGPTFAVLARPTRFELQARRNEYFSDDNFKVTWNGSSFGVVRKSDGHVMKAGLANEALAIIELKRCYPAPL